MTRLILLAGALATGIGTQAAAQGYAPQVGRRHPDFTLPRIDDGTPVRLSSLRGKKVLLIHFASW